MYMPTQDQFHMKEMYFLTWCDVVVPQQERECILLTYQHRSFPRNRNICACKYLLDSSNVVIR